MDIVIALIAAAPMVTIFSLCVRNMQVRLANLTPEGALSPVMARTA